MTTLTVGDKIVIEKGCKARNVAAHVSGQITDITPLGADYAHAVRVTFRLLNGFAAGQTRVFFARHANRLADPLVNLNDGNPLHKIVIRRR